MLIDLYERPFDPEAPKSRAFIDKIFSLTGPDGGVVGDEDDDMAASRPLKDGGREAWDMIGRLRQKAWQKAGLDPQKLYTDPVVTSMNCQVDRARGTPNANYDASDPQALSQPAKPEAAHLSLAFPGAATSTILLPKSTFPSEKTSPVVATGIKDSSSNTVHRNPSAATLSTVPIIPSGPLSTNQQYPTSAAAPPSTLSQRFVDIIPPIGPSLDDYTRMASTSSAPAIVDPSSFDWDQWDAVFGQHLPIPDEIRADDPFSGFDYWPVSESG